MQLKDFLSQKKDALLDRWLRLIVDAYPAHVSNFLKLEKDRFANPVGYNISHGIVIIFDELIHGADLDRTIPALDSIIRIQAVQDFAPSQAIRFVFVLKKVLREEVKAAGKQASVEDVLELLKELQDIEDRIDELAGLAFEIYAKCRDDVSRIKVSEAHAEKSMALRLMRSMAFREEE